MRVEEIVLMKLAERGVVKAKMLSREERSKVKELEEKYSLKRTAWGYPLNLGVLECLKRVYVVAVLTHPTFKWPPGPYAILKLGNGVVGVIDEKGLHIDRGSLEDASNEHYVIFPPLRLRELDDVFVDCVAGSPSPPTHHYLTRLLGGGGEYGSLLLGFNSLRRRHTNK